MDEDREQIIVESNQNGEKIFSHAMTEFVSDPEACLCAKRSIIGDLIYGWGNAWSAQEEYLGCCLGHALRVRAPILECGSGLSSLLVGVVAKKRGYPHWVLEHMPIWAKKVQRYLDAYELDSTVVCTKPLRDFGDFAWYDPPLQSMPDSFALVICDGPPGNTKGGRYGLASVMRDRLKAGCVVLLDDADRKKEREIARRWTSELCGTVDMLGHSGDQYIKMTLVDKSSAITLPGVAMRWSIGQVP